MEAVRHVWARRNYGHRWMPGLVLEWRATPTVSGALRWDALCVVQDHERSWVEWFGADELRPISVEPPSD